MSTPDAPSGNGISVTGYGASLRASGRDVVLILVLLAGFAGLGVIMYRGFDAVALDRQAMVEERRLQAAEHVSIVRAQNELVCALALPQEVRTAALRDPAGICHYAMMVYQFEGRRR